MAGWCSVFRVGTQCPRCVPLLKFVCIMSANGLLGAPTLALVAHIEVQLTASKNLALTDDH